MAKRCNRCEQLKPTDCYSGTSGVCKPCVVLRNKEYWRTPTGRISAIYARQVSCSKVRGHAPPEYTRKELTDWAFKQNLEALVEAWKAAGYPKELCPSIDRKDPTQGYSLNNIRLVTWQENNEKAYADRKACIHITKQNRRIEQLTPEGVHVAFYDSIAAASRATGITRTNINGMCKDKPYVKTVGGFIWRYADYQQEKAAAWTLNNNGQ